MLYKKLLSYSSKWKYVYFINISRTIELSLFPPQLYLKKKMID